VTETATATSLRAPGTGAKLAALVRADLLVLTKNKMRLLLSLLLPLIILSTTSSSRATRHFGGAEFILGLAITSGIAGTSIMGYAPMVARDRDAGVFQRLRVSPAPTWAVMASRLSVQMVSNFLIALVVLVVGADMHHLSLSPGTYALVLLVSILGSAVFLAVAQALVGLVRSADTVQASGRLLYIGLVILGLFGATRELGSFWDDVAEWSPVGALMKVFAGVLRLGSFNTQAWLSLLACAGYAVVLSALGICWFRFGSER
jgi:ABC-2 type transport system permease protein